LAEVGVELDNPAARRLYERLGYQVAAQISEEYGYTTPEGVVTRQVVDQWLLRKPVESLARTRAE
jgi:ribosomal protein S18 acetylase RimI-like enzyme